MTELTPWSESDMTDVERKLLGAAKHDGIPSQLTGRMAAALQTQAAVAGASAHGLGRAGSVLFSKASLWGFLSVAVLAGAAGWRANGSMRPPTAPIIAARADAARSQAQPAPTPKQQFYASSSGSIASPELLPAASVARRTPNNRAPGPAAARTRDISAEIALLDRARDALTSGALDRAGRALDQYRRRFDHGELAPEAEVLQIETLVKRGAIDRAQRRSQTFLKQHPRHPLAERVAELLAGPNVTTNR